MIPESSRPAVPPPLTAAGREPHHMWEEWL
jgi:hypothetical protein